MIDNSEKCTYNICTNTGHFQWNIEKSNANVTKHGVSFEEAITAFDDEFAFRKAEKVEVNIYETYSHRTTRK